MIRAIPKLIVSCPTVAEYLQENEHTGPPLFVMMLDMAANICQTPEAFHRKEYIEAVFKRIIDDVSPHYAAGPIDIRLHLLLRYTLQFGIYLRIVADRLLPLLLWD